MSGSEALENAAECGDTLSDTNASQFRYKSIYHAFRMFDEVVLECARVTEEGRCGDWLVVDFKGNMKVFRAEDFFTTFEEIPGRQFEYTCKRIVLAKVVPADEAGPAQYLIQDESGFQHLMKASDFLETFAPHTPTQDASRPGCIDLTDETALWCFKKTLYYCFQINPTRNKALAIQRRGAEIYKGTAGDWLVYSQGRAYTLTQDEFETVFSAIPGETTAADAHPCVNCNAGRKHAYRERQMYLARQMNRPFSVRTDHGTESDFHGRAGDFLVQGEFGQQLVFSFHDFAEHFDLVQDELQGFAQTDALDSLSISMSPSHTRRSSRELKSQESWGLLSPAPLKKSSSFFRENSRPSQRSSDENGYQSPQSPSQSSALWEGWVQKKGEKGMSTRWKKRWFRLEMRSLRYFNMMNSEPLGSIPLLCSNVSTAEINKESVVVIEGSERTYYLLRESTDEMRKLLALLKEVCFECSIAYLFKSAIHANTQAVERILEYLGTERRRVLSEELNDEGVHLMHLAAQSDSEDLVSLVLRHERRIIDVRDEQGFTALHYCVMRGPSGLHCLRFLLSEGANPDLASYEGVTPLHLTPSATPDMVELLIRAGAKVNVEDCNGITPLIEMAKCGNSANLEVLLNHGAIVDHKIWKDGSTALFWALADGHDICSSILIARGADCRGVDFVMNTPLLVCVTNYVEASLDDEASTDLHQRYTSCISVLLAAGAEVDATNKDGKTPLLVLCRIAPDKDEHLACDASVCALLQAGAKVNSRTPKGYEPIHYAAVSGNAPLVRLLVQHGADVNSKGPEGFTPLDYIVNKLSRRGSASIVHMSMLDATAAALRELGAVTHESDVTVETDSDEIIFMVTESGGQQLKAATLDKIIERLTFHKQTNPDDVLFFVMQYQKFLSAVELLERLKSRFQVGLGTESDEGKTIMMNVVLFLDIWSESRAQDFTLAAVVTQFCELSVMVLQTNILQQMAEQHTTSLEPLCTLMKDHLSEDVKERHSNTLDSCRPSQRISMLKMKTQRFTEYDEVDRLVGVTVKQQLAAKAAKILGPASHFMENTLLNYEPLHVAQQLTLLTHCLFTKLDTEEFLGMRFRDKEQAPNFHWLKTVTHRISFVLLSEILRYSDIDKRARVISILIRVAEICMNMNNLDSVSSITSVLGKDAVHRLKLTWAKVQKLAPQRWDMLNEATGVAGRNLEKAQQTLQPPCVPCVGIMLKHLVNIHEEPLQLTEHQLLNFNKIRKAGRVVRLLELSIQTPYLFTPDSTLLLFLLSHPIYSLEDDCWARSIELESKKT